MPVQECFASHRCPAGHRRRSRATSRSGRASTRRSAGFCDSRIHSRCSSTGSGTGVSQLDEPDALDRQPGGGRRHERDAPAGGDQPQHGEDLAHGVHGVLRRRRHHAARPGRRSTAPGCGECMITGSVARSAAATGRSSSSSRWPAGTATSSASRCSRREPKVSASKGGRARPRSISSLSRRGDLLAGDHLVQVEVDVGQRARQLVEQPAERAVGRRGGEADAHDAARTRTRPAGPAPARRRRGTAAGGPRPGTPPRRRSASTRRLSRSSSWAPTTRSSFWICRLSGGWVIFSRAAARPKCSSSATATKPRSCSNVNAMHARYQSMPRWFWTGIDLPFLRSAASGP